MNGAPRRDRGPSTSGERTGASSWLLRRGVENPADGADDFFPACRLRDQLLAAGGGQAVVLRLAVVLGGTPERRNPTAVFQPVKGGVQGPMLDLKHVLRTALDRVRDGVAVRRADHEDPQDQHVERALRCLALQRRFTTRHDRPLFDSVVYASESLQKRQYEGSIPHVQEDYLVER